MPVTNVTRDPKALTMTVTADFSAPLWRLWDAYTDPRQIEKFWGPPSWPATFTRHDVRPGGRTEYIMRGPDGQASRGYWEWQSVNAPHAFEVLDGFAREDGSNNEDMPSMRMSFSFIETKTGSRLVTTTFFRTAEELGQLLEMGMEAGMREAMGQIDGVLADLTSFAANRATLAQNLSDTQVRISRVIHGSVEQVWRAHHEPALLQRWLLGPDGWAMSLCEVATRVGDTFRYKWKRVSGADEFGFTGQVLASEPPHREVFTEAMIGMEDSSTTNELTLTPVAGGTLLSLVVTYASAEMRDQVLATGMVDGMETSYTRLEREVLSAG
jgi:uncharacterized protein YndB with AHSA1/START domain